MAPTYQRYLTGEFKDADGKVVLPDDRDKKDVDALVLGLIYVSKGKVFGGEYRAQIYPAWIDARYLWEFGAHTELEGSTFLLTATFPIPSIGLE